MTTIQSINTVPANEPKNADTYRAPTLVTLGTAVGLVQAGSLGSTLDFGSHPMFNRNFR